MTVSGFNMIYSEKYGKALLLGSDKKLLNDYYYVNDKLNKYYSDKKAVIITPNGSKNKTMKNLNNSLIRKAPDINIYITDKNDINAFAGKIGDEYCIGILQGTFKSMRALFDYIVKDESFNSIERLGKVNKDIMVEKMNQTCLDFLYMHEFFHIINGHCDLIKKIGISELCEKNDEPDDTENGLVLQTLEYDADCCAISSIINEEIRTYIMSLQAMELNPSLAAGYYDSFTNYVCQVVVSLYTFYHTLDSTLINMHNYTESELLKKKHPLAGLRIWYIIINIGCVISAWNIFDEEQIKNIVSEMMNILKKYIVLNNDIVPARFIKEILVNDIYLDHLQKIHDNWEVVAGMIDSNYGKLAPYSKFDYNMAFSER